MPAISGAHPLSAARKCNIPGNMLKFIEKRDIMEQVNLPERGERLEETWNPRPADTGADLGAHRRGGAEETLPTSIREAQSAEEANALLIQSDTGERLDVVSGQVRLIVQTRRDDMFCADYWRSGEEKGEFDLTAKENRYGAPYAYYIGTMCTRAVYSMALSYLGVDMTPVDMSVLAQRRTLNEPYDEITALVDGLARRGLTEATFDEMMAQYLNDERYSPLYIYMKRTNGVGHALLIVGYNAERKRFVAVDPSPRGFQGDTVRTYELSFAQNRQRVMRCPYAKDLEGAKVLQVYQWYWIGEGTEKE